jgi:hypothetical protein
LALLRLLAAPAEAAAMRLPAPDLALDSSRLLLGRLRLPDERARSVGDSLCAMRSASRSSPICAAIDAIFACARDAPLCRPLVEPRSEGAVCGRGGCWLHAASAAAVSGWHVCGAAVGARAGPLLGVCGAGCEGCAAGW